MIKKSRAIVLWIKLCGQVRGAWAVPSLWSGEEPGAVPSLWSGERDEAVPSLGEWVQLRGPHLITPGPEQPSPFLPQSEGNC